ncbi:MAG: hypothetical protein L0Z73_00135 [Gammaproteobacteria bacterium]|nr:hypothetical protein [Gammaproteobacteria bacterium]
MAASITKLANNRIQPTQKAARLMRALCAQMTITKTIIFIVLFAMAVNATAENIWVMAKGGVWEPKESTLTAMKSGVESYVKNEAKKQKQQLLDWNEYMFQYLTVEVKDKKSILINAICGKRNPQELENFYLTAGGGNCYFSLEYNPEKKRYYDLFINGGT